MRTMMELSEETQAETAGDLADLRENASRASSLLKAMANKQRLVILCHLVEGEKTVGALRAEIGLSQSALSQHLAVLRHDRLVQARRAGTSVIYSLASPEAAAMMVTLYGLFCDSSARVPIGEKNFEQSRRQSLGQTLRDRR
jgi:DNA-binding transcriptional ArsR family regulator